MNATTMNRPQPLVNTAQRVGVALAVAACIAGAWAGAERSSHEAVRLSSATLSRTYVTLPTVEIVARREAPRAPVAQSGGLRPSSL